MKDLFDSQGLNRLLITIKRVIKYFTSVTSHVAVAELPPFLSHFVTPYI